MWDLAEDRDSIGLIERTIAAGKPVALFTQGRKTSERAAARPVFSRP